MLRESEHGLAVIGGDIIPSGRAGLRPVPAGEHVGVAFHHILVVAGNRLTVGIELLRAIRVQLEQTDRKQLHDFARVVFVWLGVATRVRLIVVHHVEEIAHGRVQGDVFKELPEIAEGVAGQRIPVGGHGLGMTVHAVAVGGDDHDFTEGEGDTLTELIRGGHDRVPPCFLKHGIVRILSRGKRRDCELDPGKCRRGWSGKLLIEKRGEARLLHLAKESVGRTEGGLV